MAGEGDPRPQYAPDRALYERYADKAAELGVGFRTIERWVQGFQRRGEAGLVGSDQLSHRKAPKVDDRWVETALEVMGEHKEESKPSRTLVIERTQARVIARFDPGAVAQPSRAAGSPRYAPTPPLSWRATTLLRSLPGARRAASVLSADGLDGLLTATAKEHPGDQNSTTGPRIAQATLT